MDNICKNCKYFYRKLYTYDDSYIQEMNLCKKYSVRVAPFDEVCKEFKDISSIKN